MPYLRVFWLHYVMCQNHFSFQWIWTLFQWHKVPERINRASPKCFETGIWTITFVHFKNVFTYLVRSGMHRMVQSAIKINLIWIFYRSFVRRHKQYCIELPTRSHLVDGFSCYSAASMQCWTWRFRCCANLYCFQFNKNIHALISIIREWRLNRRSKCDVLIVSQ